MEETTSVMERYGYKKSLYVLLHGRLSILSNVVRDYSATTASVAVESVAVVSAT